ncbi:plasmid stabilization protein [Scytonema hofmannii PCC 7110]|uniref:Plasmid stabilization protein n=1 Tax=Scytonema hofmannii PCC 7110 TaxID=128403 RepID=A0A139X8Y7_9CYAN|nr:type II toxin-antitoxin system RelE/ParE family toxin [Scytonema hofmannii]KYC41102.1 plasmid stabilization protein [Scytonema hofmannii PCC 7110]
MGRLIRTARAEEDLIEIWLYIAADNQQAADKLVNRIDAKCQMLANSAGVGSARPDIAPDLRYFPVGHYLILYREILNGIEVVRVVHGARHLPDIEI